MIEKKFKALEELEKQLEQQKPLYPETQQEDLNRKDEEGLNEAQLESLFKETSTFSVDYLMDRVAAFDPGVADDEAFAEYFSDGEDDTLDPDGFWDDADEEFNSRRKRKFSNTNRNQSVVIEVTGEGGFVYTIKKRAKPIDPNEPIFTRIPPPPLTRSWALPIEPFQEPPKEVEGSQYVEVDSVLSVNLKSLVDGREILGILMDPPWKANENENNPQCIEPKALKFIAQAVKNMDLWGFHYVENLVWVKMGLHNQPLRQDSEFFCRSKMTLLIFRKGEGGIELRHQRSPDVVFDYVQTDKGLTEDKPDFVYQAIETLLPTANYDPSTGHGKLIELWAKKGTRRKGWVSVAQK